MLKLHNQLLLDSGLNSWAGTHALSPALLNLFGHVDAEERCRRTNVLLDDMGRGELGF